MALEDAEIGALPKMIRPPQRPSKVGSRLGLAFSPGIISSATDVKIIGESAVPFANNFPPLAIRSAVELGPVPA